jgi:geranylgeranyl diphosphate synthase, type II
MSDSLARTSAAHRTRVDADLGARADGWAGAGWPPALAEAARYTLFGGGKRVRPVLALMAAEAVGGAAEQALPWACAVEMIHTYSLVHDDLPAMDDDDERRGRPTCHVKYGEALAILAGDVLLTEAFAVLAGAPQAQPLTALLSRAAGGAGMVGGQVLDIGGGLGDLDALVHMQRLKTGALIRAAGVGGALSAGADPGQIEAVGRYGEALGLLFQITDDLLDAEQDAGRDPCNFLHFMSHAEVLTQRDATLAQAERALAALGDGAGDLLALARGVATRTV